LVMLMPRIQMSVWFAMEIDSFVVVVTEPAQSRN
jgi:hypothetical protein